MGRRGRGGRGDDRRKDLQLCAQVRRTLDLALAEASDERLLGAWVREVLPNPDVGRLRVVVEVGPEGDPDEVLFKQNLDALNRQGDQPWALSFSYGRALQEPAQHAWAGRPDNTAAAQQALYKRAKLNGLARAGRYSPELEQVD